MIYADALCSADPDRLWALVSDLEGWPSMLPTVTSVRALGSRPVGVGSRFEVRQPGVAKAVYEVSDWQPGRRFTWAARLPGVSTTATHVVTASGEGARVDLTLDWSGALAPVVRLVYGKRVRTMVELEANTFARLAQPQ